MQLTLTSVQRVLSSRTPSWSPSTVSLTTSTTRPSAGTLTSGTGRRAEPAPIARWGFAALPCSSPVASTSSPASSLSAARQKRPEKVKGSKLMFYLASPTQHLFSHLFLSRFINFFFLSFIQLLWLHAIALFHWCILFFSKEFCNSSFLVGLILLALHDEFWIFLYLLFYNYLFHFSCTSCFISFLNNEVIHCQFAEILLAMY